MKVKLPMFSAEARGAIGGLVYNTWRGINTVKINTSPTGQGTTLRLAAQALMALVAKVWATIGDANRANWNTYATDHPITDWVGSPKRLTGMNWFVKCNVQLKRVGQAIKNTIPVLAQPDAITGLTLSHIGADIVMAWTTPATGEFSIDVWLVGPLSQGITVKLEKAQWRRFALPTDFAGVILESAAALGRWTVFARVICANSGLVSTWQSAYCDVD